ncbi:DUF418 domain-containing protein [Cryobacterium roopkundense]|uniref:Putative membrane protein YeiB n=1 Tax=Cryobacterium roopkundense TaxID=1001240 RepID=A0A7W9E2E7_9MICO|nr:DUF418 domain-containing protein [Cryobacterium roopkundense]MBB5640522.1 putative membrane protein YeiB [Cryobacterium roopkundense]
MPPRLTPGATQRWAVIDALRGFALCGILLVNIPDIVQLGYGLEQDSAPVAGKEALEWLVQTRFVPIFTFLFGMSLTFVAHGARRGERRPWSALVARLMALFVIGLLHSLIYPGEVLREYAVIGLLVVPVVLLAPRTVQLVLGVVLVVAAYAATGGGLAATPGLMLLGAALGAFGLGQALDTRSRAVVATFAISMVLLIPGLLWQGTAPGDPRFLTPGSVAGLIMASIYVTGLSFLWNTPARKLVTVLFEPIGRMSLSNYVGASVIVFSVSAVVDFTTMTTIGPVLLLALGILVMQNVASRVWLHYFRYGPVEWIWRMVTWRERISLGAAPPTTPRRDAAGAAAV